MIGDTSIKYEQFYNNKKEYPCLYKEILEYEEVLELQDVVTTHQFKLAFKRKVVVDANVAKMSLVAFITE